MVPRVSGIVRQVRKSLGDPVKDGEIMAVIESRELAAAKATYLAAIEREKLAQANFAREEGLWRKKVTSEQEYLDARQALAETRIEKSSAEQQLHALGFSDAYLKELPEQADATYTRYEIRAPFAGTIIEKHLTLGENVNADSEVFTIADLSTVWVDINVYQKDLPKIRKGQKVVIEAGHDIPAATGTIAWLGPLVGEATRTAKARVILPNPDRGAAPGALCDRPGGRRQFPGRGGRPQERPADFRRAQRGLRAGRGRLRAAAGGDGTAERHAGGNPLRAEAGADLRQRGRLHPQGAVVQRGFRRRPQPLIESEEKRPTAALPSPLVNDVPFRYAFSLKVSGALHLDIFAQPWDQ